MCSQLSSVPRFSAPPSPQPHPLSVNLYYGDKCWYLSWSTILTFITTFLTMISGLISRFNGINLITCTLFHYSRPCYHTVCQDCPVAIINKGLQHWWQFVDNLKSTIIQRAKIYYILYIVELLCIFSHIGEQINLKIPRSNNFTVGSIINTRGEI